MTLLEAFKLQTDPQLCARLLLKAANVLRYGGYYDEARQLYEELHQPKKAFGCIRKHLKVLDETKRTDEIIEMLHHTIIYDARKAKALFKTIKSLSEINQLHDLLNRAMSKRLSKSKVIEVLKCCLDAKKMLEVLKFDRFKWEFFDAYIEAQLQMITESRLTSQKYLEFEKILSESLHLRK